LFQIKFLLYGWWVLEENASRPPHVINSGIALSYNHCLQLTHLKAELILTGNLSTKQK